MLSTHFKIFCIAFFVVLPTEGYARSSKKPIDLNLLQQKKAVANSVSRTQLDISKQRSFSLKTDWKVLEQVSVSKADEEFSEQKNVGSFKLDAGQTISSERNFDKSKPLVLYHVSSQNMGVLTGTLVVKLKSKETQIDSILNDYNLKLIQAFPHLSLYYITSNKDVFDLEASMNSLSQDQRVKSVDLEILSRTYEKK